MDVGFLSKAIQYVVLSDDDVGFLSKAIQYVVLSDGCGFLVKGHSVCSVIRWMWASCQRPSSM